MIYEALFIKYNAKLESTSRPKYNYYIVDVLLATSIRKKMNFCNIIPKNGLYLILDTRSYKLILDLFKLIKRGYFLFVHSLKFEISSFMLFFFHLDKRFRDDFLRLQDHLVANSESQVSQRDSQAPCKNLLESSQPGLCERGAVFDLLGRARAGRHGA